MAMRGSSVGRYNRMMRSGVTDEPTRKTDARTVRRVARSFKPYLAQVLVVLRHYGGERCSASSTR